MLSLCKVSKYPLDLRAELATLGMFCKRVQKEENIDGKKIRGIIDELDGLKRENMVMTWTCVN